MAKIRTKNIMANLEQIGLSEKQISIFFNCIHEQYWQESINIYKDLFITRNSLDTSSEIYLLIKHKNKGYDTNLEVVDGKFVSFCSCSHREDAKGCAHVGAVLLHKMLKENKNDFNLKIDFKKVKDVKSGDLEYFRKLFPIVDNKAKKNMIYFDFEDFNRRRQMMRVSKGVIRKNGMYGAPVKFSAKSFNSETWDISKNVKRVLNYMSNGGDYEGHSSSSSGFSKNRFYDVNTDLMMPVLRDLFFEEREIILGADFAKGTFNITWDISKNRAGMYVLEPFFVLDGKKTSLLKIDIFEVGSTSLWVFDCKSRVFSKYQSEENLDVVRSVIRFPKKLELDEKALRNFFIKYYQKIIDGFNFNIASSIERKSRNAIPQPKVYLEKSGTTVKVNLRFEYLGREIDYFSKNKELIVIEDDVIYDVSRDFEVEEQIVDALNERSIVMHDKIDEFKIEGDLVDFISEQIPIITKEGIDVLGEDKIFTFKLSRIKPKMNLDASSKTDWFSLKGTVAFGQEEVDMRDVLEAIFENKRFIDLKDNKRGVIPKKWINNLRSYEGFFEMGKDGINVSKYHTSIMDTMLEMSSKANIDPEVKEVVNKFKNLDKVTPTKLSKNIKATLREYQKNGYDWLCFLKDHGFNGVLADDMGLGKTIQAISVMQKMKDDKKDSSFLVVVPTSLVFNWKAELEKFAPTMKVSSHHGQNRVKAKTDAAKKKFAQMVKDNDIIITTYGILRNDMHLFADTEFDYIALDEAHVIKNPMSISAKSVCALNGKHRLVISGTPIQNNLTELWSLYNFLNPGYLGGYEFFREKFVLPIERAQDKNVSDALRKLINPFLLRRTKEVIADELPDKTEMVLEANFGDEEKKIYSDWKEYYKYEIKNMIKDKGVAQSKMKILEGLMKLRQIALHPKMVDANYKGSSAKFELLMMEIEKVMNEGHKVLVFSSFVKMLSIIKDEFEKRGLDYSYLDGQTKNREKVVDGFNNAEDARSFLISIKAGGVGLNLTSADYVFIVDPWWNPAVESQAMDRAHRIGQKKKVFVYKMITKDTIEEKILELQKSKKRLVEDLIIEDSGFVKNIDVKDIKELFG